MTRWLMAAALLLSAAAAQAEPAGARIGFIYHEHVEYLFEAAQKAVSDVNAAGGVRGAPLALIGVKLGREDDARRAATRLLDHQGVSALIASYRERAVAAVAQERRIAFLALDARIASFGVSGSANVVFSTYAAASDEARALAGLLRARGVDRVAVAIIDNDGGIGGDAFVAAFDAAGGEIAAFRRFSYGRDYRPMLRALAASGASTLVIYDYPDVAGAALLRQSVEIGAFTRFALPFKMIDDAIAPALGANASALAVQPRAAAYRGSQPFADGAMGVGVDFVTMFAAQSYDAAFVLALALEAAGAAEPKALPGAIRRVARAPGAAIFPGEWAKARRLLRSGAELDYHGVSGPLEFGSDGRARAVYAGLALQKGEWVDLGDAPLR